MIYKLLRIEGLLILWFAIILYTSAGYSWLWFVVLLLLPDISMAGYVKNTKLGATIYNIGHSFILPVLLAAVGYLVNTEVFYALALIWLAHIGMDRMFGYGLKYDDDFKHTHLGWIGGNTKTYNPAANDKLITSQQTEKNKRLTAVEAFIDKKGRVTNEDVQKLLNVSRATAERYLDELESNGTITQQGKTGRSTFYTKN